MNYVLDTQLTPQTNQIGTNKWINISIYNYIWLNVMSLIHVQGATFKSRNYVLDNTNQPDDLTILVRTNWYSYTSKCHGPVPSQKGPNYQCWTKIPIEAVNPTGRRIRTAQWNKRLSLVKRWAKFRRLETMFLKKKSSSLNDEYTHKLKYKSDVGLNPKWRRKPNFAA